MEGRGSAGRGSPLYRVAVVFCGLTALLAGCSAEGHETVREQVEQVIDANDTSGTVDRDDRERGEGADVSSSDGADESGVASASGLEAAPSGLWALLLLLLLPLAALAPVAYLAVRRSRARRKERETVRADVLTDVDWILRVSEEPPAPTENASRRHEVRRLTARLHDTLARLSLGSEQPTAAAALRLRDETAALTGMLLDRFESETGGANILEVPIDEQRERVRAARRAFDDTCG